MNIHISDDEALVLFEFFSRFQDTNRLRLLNNAEFIALSSIAGQIEKVLVTPFQSDYKDSLAKAQTRIANGYEGLAPGVEPT